MQYDHKHSFETVLCFSWKIENIDFCNLSAWTTTLLYLTATHHETRGQREVYIAVSHRTTSYDLTTERGINYSVSQSYIVRPDNRERYILQCLLELHRATWQQREVHITVSHSTTSYDLRTERGTHYSVSQHHIVRPDNKKRYTLQCLTYSYTTSYYRREEKKSTL